MHGLGKFLLFLTVVCAIAGVALSAHLLDIRGQWQKKLVDLEEQVKTRKAELASRRAAIENLKGDIELFNLQFGRQWSSQGSIDNQQEGRVSLNNVGLTNGIGIPRPTNGQAPEYHVFQYDPQGSNYLGLFSANDIQENSTRLVAVNTPWFNEPVDPTGTADKQPYQWNPEIASNNWARGLVTLRVRERVPEEYSLVFEEIEQYLNFQVEDWRKQIRNVNLQKELLARVRKLRDTRIAELLGDDYLPPEERIPQQSRDFLPELVLGYLKALDQADGERNVVLEQVDDLRREVKRVNDRITALVSKNQELANRLPESDGEGDASGDQVSSRPRD